eukprot:IDg4030t1
MCGGQLFRAEDELCWCALFESFAKMYGGYSYVNIEESDCIRLDTAAQRVGEQLYLNALLQGLILLLLSLNRLHLG